MVKSTDDVFHGCRCSPFHCKPIYLMDPFRELPNSALHFHLSTQPLISKINPSIAHLLALRKSATFLLHPVEPGTEGNALVCSPEISTEEIETLSKKSMTS